MGEPGLIVRGQREEERALRPQLHIDARHVEQLGSESGPAPLALTAERGQVLFAGLRLRARRQHAGGCVACAGTGRASVEDLDGCAPLRQPPGNAKANHPAADDGDAGVAGIGCAAIRQPSAPFAGMTQTERSPVCNRKGLRSQTAPKARIGAPSVSGTVANRGSAISVELDAIEPNQLRALVQDAIERHLPAEQFAVLKAAEES